MRYKKYIIVECFPVIFDPAIQHDDIARNLPYKITSAGFMKIENVKEQLFIKCWGESNSLNIKSNPEDDKKIIQRFFNSLRAQ